MNIVLLAENWPPRVGGIENYLESIARHLPKGSVTVVAPPAVRDATSAAGGGIARVLRRRFFWPLIRPAWVPLYIWLHRRAKREPLDMLLCGKGLFEGLVGYYLKKYLGVPYAVFTYAMEIQTWSAKGSTRRKLGRVLSDADRVVYINDVTKKHLLALGVQERQLIKIWPGVGAQYFAAADAAQDRLVLEKYHLVPQKYILSVARLIERKGLDILIEAFAKIDQTKFSELTLAIVGAGPELEKLKGCARQNFAERSVVFLEHVPARDLPALYRQARFFALTPRDMSGDSEGFGIVYIEAAAAGRPALATHVGGAPEAVVHQETGLVVAPNSVSAVVEGLHTLLNNPTELERLAQAARARAYREFRWPKRILLVKGMIDAILTPTAGSGTYR